MDVKIYLGKYMVKEVVLDGETDHIILSVAKGFTNAFFSNLKISLQIWQFSPTKMGYTFENETLTSL